MATLNTLRVKTLTLKLSYLNAECEEVTLKCEAIDKDIWGFIKDRYPEEFELAINVGPRKNKNLIDNDSQLKCQNKDVKKIYRKIVEVSHPDKSDGKEHFFRQATEHYKTHNIGGLIELATELGLELEDLSEESLELLNENILSAEKRLESLKSSTAWFWYNAENDDQKNELALFVLEQKGVSINHLKSQT